MGYNATHILANFEQYAGLREGYEPARRGSGYRQRFPSGAGSSLLYRRDRQGRVIEIQSYGDHFPLGTLQLTPSGRRRRWLLNGDTWPGGGFGRTNEHNDILRALVQNSTTPWFIVPFSAIRAAAISPDTITPVDVQPETWEQTDHAAATLDEVPEDHRKQLVFRDEDGRAIIAPRSPDGRQRAWPDYTEAGVCGWSIQTRRLGNQGYSWYKDIIDGPAYTGMLSSEFETLTPAADGLYHWTTERHWLGASLFRARYSTPGRHTGKRWVNGRAHWAYFVTAFDENEPRPLWFMSELPRGVAPATVAEAISALKPQVVRDAEAAGVPVIRQGDVFVIQASTVVLPLNALEGETLESRPVTERELTAQGGELVPFTPSTRSRWGGQGGGRFINDSHTATRVIRMPNGTLMARGIMRHRPAGRRPDHVNRELWDRQTWGRVALNTVPRSFDGTVDTSMRSWSLRGDVD